MWPFDRDLKRKEAEEYRIQSRESIKRWGYSLGFDTDHPGMIAEFENPLYLQGTIQKLQERVSYLEKLQIKKPKARK